jgi:hypothetical protein
MEDIMAEKTKKAVDNATENADVAENTVDNATEAKRVTVKLPKLRGQNANQEEFYSVNGKNYRIRRGVEVEIPEEVAEVIRNADLAEEYAMEYAEEIAESWDGNMT